MASFKIHRLKENAAAQFRWAPHTSGPASVKLKDYEVAETIEAVSAYGLFNELRATPSQLRVGDLVEAPGGALRIYKYVGLEEAVWLLPVSKDGQPFPSGTQNPAVDVDSASAS